MAIDLTYRVDRLEEVQRTSDEEPQKRWTKKRVHYNTEQEAVKEIIPQENKVAIHLEGETIMIPFSRVLELRVDLDPETVKQVEQANKEE